MQQLSALTERDPNKGMKSRLRRAFSFGSAHELRKAAGENHAAGKVRTVLSENSPVNAEDAAIAAKQEAAGLGAGI